MSITSRDAIEAAQITQLRVLIERSLGYNEFYRRKFDSAGLARSPLTLREFRERTPFTFKEELVEDQRRRPPYGTNLAYPPADYSRVHSTSGTTASPLRWLDTPESWDWVISGWLRVFEASGVTRDDRIFFPFSFGPFLGFWSAFDAAVKLGCLAIPGGGMRTSTRLQAILENRATAVCATPTYAIRLGEAAAAEGVDLARAAVKALIVAGEPGGSAPATRKLLEKLWPTATVFDHHGMTEVGPVTYQCATQPGALHVMESGYLAEVIDPKTEAPTPPGGEGELVLTTLGRVASPAIRYRTRDIVRIAPKTVCACGTAELTLEGGILGRVDDMVIVRGVNLYPSAVEEVLRSAGGVAEFRVEIREDRGMYDVNVLVEPVESETGEALRKRVEAALHRAFGLRFSVAAAEPESLPRFEAKARRWVRV